MTTSPNSSIAVAITPWHCRHYAALQSKTTMADVERHIRQFDADLTALRAMGDHDAVRGATALLKAAVLELIAVDATSLRALKKKVKTLARWSHLMDRYCDPIIGVALRMDMLALDLLPVEEAQVRALLPSENEGRTERRSRAGA